MAKQKIFIAVVLVILLIPFAGMAVSQGEFNTENSELAGAPELFTDEGDINISFISDAGEYFEDHFAFRSDVVNLNALLQSRVFQTSSARNIVVGEDDWLYYGDTLDNYQRVNSFSDRDLYNIAHNLKLMQDYLELLGSEMYFTVGPNKASIHSENMPYYMIGAEGQSDLDRLVPYLEEAGVRYINTQEALLGERQESDEQLYYKYDTHWNMAGADIAADTILTALGKNAASEVDKQVGVHYGDLAEMLFPQSGFNEPDVWTEYSGITSLKTEDENGNYKDLPYTYEDGAAVTDSETYMNEWIEGTGSGEGNLFVFRDSFGCALIRPLTSAYANTVFSRYEPYALVNAYLYEADDVLIVLAERNIGDLIESPAVMQAPFAEIGEVSSAQTDTTCLVETDGGYYVIEGNLDPEYRTDTAEIYVNIYYSDGTYITYEPFYTVDFGYQMYLLADETQESIEIVVSDNGNNTAVLTGVSFE